MIIFGIFQNSFNFTNHRVQAYRLHPIVGIKIIKVIKLTVPSKADSDVYDIQIYTPNKRWNATNLCIHQR